MSNCERSSVSPERLIRVGQRRTYTFLEKEVGGGRQRRGETQVKGTHPLDIVRRRRKRRRRSSEGEEA